ncbi:MAG: hypothetical protein J6M12_05355 [Clostridia bacterium]|nr:hypothetical protein [Clostridia bacterium]
MKHFKKINQLLRSLAMLLCIVLLLPLLPVLPASAEDPSLAAEGSAEGEVTVVCEDESKRTAFEKHYLLSDGTYYAVSYAEAVHEQDEQGKWVDADSAPVYDEDEDAYLVKGKGYRASFGLLENKAALINKKGQALCWHYELIGYEDEKAVMKLEKKNAKAQGGKNASPKGKKVGDKDAFALPEAQGELLFEDAFSALGAEVRYTVSPQKIKEDVILNERGKVYALSMVIENCDYKARLVENAVILEDSKGNDYFYVDAPLMYDAAGESSTDVNVLLKQTGKTVTVTYTPDKEWLDAPERVYPVTFDPAVTTEDYAANIEDTFVIGGRSADYSAVTSLQVGQQNGYDYTGYIRINNLPETGTLPILSAKLTLRANSSVPSQLVGKNLQLQEIEYIGSFSALPNITEFGIFYPVDKHAIENTSDATYNLNLLTSRFISALYNDTSICYRLNFAETTTKRISIYSSEASSYQPVLTVCYGYQIPEGNLTTNTLNGTNSLYLCDTSAIDNGKKMLSASGSTLSMVNYTTTSLNTVFFLEANSTNTAIHIFAYYPQQTIGAASASDGSAVTLGGAVTNWIQIRLASGQYLIVLEENPMLALTRSSSGLTVTQISSDLSATQVWDILCAQSSTRFDIGTFPNGIYYINSAYTHKFLIHDDTLSLSSAIKSELGDKMAWNVAHVGNSYYTIESMENRGLFLHMTEDAVTLEQITTENAPDSALFSIEGTANAVRIVGKQSGKYLSVLNTSVQPSISTGNESKWRIRLSENYTELPSFTLSATSLWLEPYESEDVAIEPDISSADFIDPSDFRFTSSNTGAATISSSIPCSITGTTQGGISYVTATHIPTGKTKTVTVKVGLLPEGSYFIRNRESELFLRYGINVQEDYVSIGEMSGGGYPGDGYTGYYYEWQLTLLADGYYKISCRKLSNVLGLRNGEETLSGNIYWQTDSGSTGQKWRPYALTSGGYKIISATTYGTSNELVITENSADSAVQGAYSNNSDRSDEWDFVQITTELPIELEAQIDSNTCWAAATVMFSSKYTLPYRNQEQLRNTIHEDFLEGGNLNEINIALRQCLGLGDNSEENFALQDRIYSEANLQRILNGNHPLIVGVLWYEQGDDADNKADSGHAIVLYGICKIENDTFYMIRDPGPADVGTTRIVSYDDLRSNYTYHEDNQSANNTVVRGYWTHTFVYLSELEDDFGGPLDTQPCTHP